MRVSPLSDKHLLEVTQASDRALAQWLTAPEVSEPLAFVRALERVLLFLKQNGDASAQARQVSSLAFAFGQQLVRTGAWEWKSVSEDGSVNPSVVNGAGRACLVVDTVTAMVTQRSSIGLVELYRGLLDDAATDVPGVVRVTPMLPPTVLERLERDLLARLSHIRGALRMWRSPEELEAVAEHFTHVLLLAQRPGWTFEQTHALWTSLGGPFSRDPDEHADMRSRMWGEQVEVARSQVTLGYVEIWALLDREPEREAVMTPWIEELLDAPTLAGAPDCLNAVLFSLIGFVARDPQAYVTHLSAERERRGGHSLRPFHIVGPHGPSEAALTYTRKFSSWDAVSTGIERVVKALGSELRELDRRE
ncbi:MAG: hypothetical protein Q8S33_22940 [Myxococcales bacterium]|nr:hypothetical protein [Myxococcales bacterium]